MHKKLLILDLVETLIFATKESLDCPFDFIYESYYIYKRPLLDEFLHGVAQKYLLAVWSSGDDDYLIAIVHQSIPADIKLEFIWGKSRCTYRRDVESGLFHYEKRLKKIIKMGFALKATIIVDNTKEKSRENYGNAIHIEDFCGDPSDRELPKLNDYLSSISSVENIQSIEKRNWNK